MTKRNTHLILDGILAQLRPTAVPSAYKEALNTFKQEVREFLQGEFPRITKLCGEPFEMGSTKKGTEVALHYDLDLFLPFHRNAFKDEHEMRNVVLKACQAHVFKAHTEVRDQRVSVGLSRPFGSQVLEVDVVPGMEKEQAAFKAPVGDSDDSAFLVLYDRVFNKTITTNVHRQVRLIKANMGNYRDVVRLLKAWRTRIPNEHPLGSYALELMVYQAATKPLAPTSGNPELLLRHVLTHCIQELPKDWVLQDLGSGTKWPDYLKKGAKEQLAGLWRKLLATLDEGDPEKIRRAFLP